LCFSKEGEHGASIQINIGELLSVLVAHDKASVVEFFNRPWWWERATRHQALLRDQLASRQVVAGSSRSLHVDKMRLSREMAINLQSSAARLVQSFADPRSMKNSSLCYFFNRVRLAHFDVGVRKPMFKWQACSHRILTAHINRISSTIYLEDVALMRETAIHRDASFHGDTPSLSSGALCARRDTVRSAGISRRSRV